MTRRWPSPHPEHTEFRLWWWAVREGLADGDRRRYELLADDITIAEAVHWGHLLDAADRRACP